VRARVPRTLTQRQTCRHHDNKSCGTSAPFPSSSDIAAGYSSRSKPALVERAEGRPKTTCGAQCPPTGTATKSPPRRSTMFVGCRDSGHTPPDRPDLRRHRLLRVTRMAPKNSEVDRSDNVTIVGDGPRLHGSEPAHPTRNRVNAPTGCVTGRRLRRRTACFPRCRRRARNPIPSSGLSIGGDADDVPDLTRSPFRSSPPDGLRAAAPEVGRKPRAPPSLLSLTRSNAERIESASN